VRVSIFVSIVGVAARDHSVIGTAQCFGR
jgi:hypothetical protein